MPYSSMNSVPKALKTAGLSLGQANDWARYYDEAKKSGDVSSPAALAWKRFKSKYYKEGNKWKIKKSYKGEKKMPEKFKGYELLYRYSPQTLALEDVEAEGKVYEKELIREGEWVHPQRTNVKLKITLARMKQWIENFQKNLFKVPVPKRHSLDPEDNRGWVKKLILRKADNGKHALFGHIDITNKKMQEMIDNGDIQDVSVSIAPYQDNKGIKHGETLQHVALTVIPHIDKQKGFTPVNAEGFLCLEEAGYIEQEKNKIGGMEELEIQKHPEGSQESVKEDLHKAITEARLFPEPQNFNIVGTYPDRVIVRYFGGGTGETGIPSGDTYFEILYTKDLNRRYIFGDKKELIKKYYFIQKEYKNQFEKPNKEKKEKVADKKQKKEEVKKMEEFETLKEQNEQLEAEKVELSKKVETVEAENGELKTKIAELEKVGKEQKEQLDKIEADKQAAFEAEIESKVSSLVEKGHVLPEEKDEVKEVFLQGGKVVELLEKTLKERKAVDLEDKTKSKSDKPKEGEGLTKEQAKAEAKRIAEGK